MAQPLFKRTCGSLQCPWILLPKPRIKKPQLRLFDHTPTWTHLELSQMDVGHFF